MKRYEQIALTLDASRNCVKSGNLEWKERHEATLDTLMRNTAPSGSGIDHGTELLASECKPGNLVFETAFHHMDEHGYYDGWTDHKVIVTPSFIGDIDIRITGRDRHFIKDYLADVYHSWLTEEETPTASTEEAETALAAASIPVDPLDWTDEDMRRAGDILDTAAADKRRGVGSQ